MGQDASTNSHDKCLKHSGGHDLQIRVDAKGNLFVLVQETLGIGEAHLGIETLQSMPFCGWPERTDYNDQIHREIGGR